MSDEVNPRYPLFAIRLEPVPDFVYDLKLAEFPTIWDGPVRMQLAHVETLPDGRFKVRLGRVNMFEDANLGVLHTDMDDNYRLGLTTVDGEVGGGNEKATHYAISKAEFVEEGTANFFDEEDCPFSVWILTGGEVNSEFHVSKIGTQYSVWYDGNRTKLPGVLVWTSRD